jgi:2',3'-cyclic-nucleotide 2'-phosphodiesterase (5'-nucleotidase family)
MASMIQTIKKEYSQNVLYLDAGDQYQGGIEASKLISNGSIMNDFFNIVGLNGSSIGNH